MLPLRDDNPTTRKPIGTMALLAACCVVFFLVQPSGHAQVSAARGTSDTRYTVDHAGLKHGHGHPIK